MLLHQELTNKILKACYTVHNELGCGVLEQVYQEALAIQMTEIRIPLEREKQLPITYLGKMLNCEYFADFVVDNKVIVELKAVTEMSTVFEAQTINYLKATGIKVGLLINFGVTQLQIKRFAY